MSEPEPEPAAAFALAEVRLCAFDLDGTLCRPDNTVSPRTKAAVQAVRNDDPALLPLGQHFL